MRWFRWAQAAAVLLWADYASAGGTHGGRAMPVDPTASADFRRIEERPGVPVEEGKCTQC